MRSLPDLFSTVYFFLFIDTCDHEQKKNEKKIKSNRCDRRYIEKVFQIEVLCVPIHIGMLISEHSNSNSNCKAECTVLLMSIGNNMRIQNKRSLTAFVGGHSEMA